MILTRPTGEGGFWSFFRVRFSSPAYSLSVRFAALDAPYGWRCFVIL